MESFTEKMFDFQRRATQAVLQKMGAADTTVDEQFDNTLSNFKRLGEFLHHMEEQTQQSLSSMEKMCYTNNALASSLCNFVFSELSNDDNEFSTGLLSKFFMKTSAQPNRTPAENTTEFNQRQSTFQESVQRLYDSLGTMGHENFKTSQESLGYQVLNPIKKDEDVNRVTKQLLEKRKKLVLEFDSLKRTSDFDKIRQAKEEFEAMSKKTSAHLQNRSFIRCKLIVHTIVSMIQQFCLFFESNAILLEGLASFIEPLVGAYQLNSEQLSDIYAAKKPSSTPTTATTSATSPAQNNSPMESRSPNYPSTPPPSYKEHVEHHNLNTNTNNNNSANDIKRNNSNNSFENDFSKMSFTNGQKTSPSPPATQTQKEAKLFSVWDEDAGGSNYDESPPTNTNTTNNNTTTTNNNNNNTTPTKKQNADDDWMYNSSTPKTNNKTSSNGGMNSSSEAWQDPLIPESTPKTNNNYTSYNSTPQQTHFNNSTPFNNSSNSNFSRPQTPLHNNYQPPQQQQPHQQPHQQQPQQQQQQPQQQQQQQKPKSGFENIFGDFDFTPPPQQRNNNNNTANFSTGGPTTSSNGFNPNFNPTNISPHVDHSQHQRTIIEPVVSEKIKNWGEKNGKKNNLRVLLSTLHEVLWEESGWEKITYGAIITPAQVKKVYRKAIMVVHPDKVHLGTAEQKMLAQRIFECLRESFDVFKVGLEAGN